MALQTASTLYPTNSTVVDSGAVDIRFLSSTSGTADNSQSNRWTHTQDGQSRTIDPGNTLVTTNNDPHGFQGLGYALRLTEDMTPGDDTNCNAVLTSGTLSVVMRNQLNSAGGTNLGGVNTFNIRASLWRYDPVANTGSVIATGTQNQTWDTGLGNENNVFKNTTLSINIATDVEFSQGEILLLQLGARAQTLVDASFGTTNYDLVLTVNNTTRIDFNAAANQYISQVCYIEGTSNASSTVTGVAAPVYPTQGSSSGLATVSASLEADKETAGSSSGSATTTATLVGVKETIGSSSGLATVDGTPAIVVPTVGEVEIGAVGVAEQVSSATATTKSTTYLFGG